MELPAGVELIGTLPNHGGQIHSIAWSPDGSLLATAGIDAVAGVWDRRSLELLQLISERISGHAAAFAMNGRSLAVGTVDDVIELGEVGKWRKARKIPVPEAVGGLLSPREDLLACWAVGEHLRFLQIPSAKAWLYPATKYGLTSSAF